MNEKIIFSNSAYNDLVNEVYNYIETETGGIFLGHYIDDIWYVIEIIDPGYQNIIRQQSYFEYDQAYVTHLANILSRKYKKQLSLIGLWHRHPSSMDTFSLTDDTTNKKFSALNKYGAISALVNLDPNFRLTVYTVPHNPSFISNGFLKRPEYKKVKNTLIGNEHIPIELLELKTYRESLNDFQSDRQLIQKNPWYKKILKKENHMNLDDEDLLFKKLDIELDFLENQTNYTYEIEPVNFTDNSINVKLKYLSTLDYYPESILLKLFIKKNKVYVTIKGNDSEEINDLYIDNIIKKYIDKYIKAKNEQKQKKTTQYLNRNNLSNIKEEEKNIKLINNYLEKLDYHELLINGNYNSQDIKKIKRSLMKILHPDKKENDETLFETEKLSDIFIDVNNALTFLDNKYKEK